MATGCLPIRDMITSKPGVSEHAAQHLAADIGGAGFVVGQNAARGRQDRDAEPAIDTRQIDKLRVDTAAGFGDARNLPDDRLAIDVFQFDLELGDAGADLLSRKAADIAFALQDIQNVGAHLRCRRGDDRLAGALSVADARQFELAVNAARAAGQRAAVANARLRAVARQFGQLQLRLKALLRSRVAVARDRLQPLAARVVALGELSAPVVLFDRTLLSHRARISAGGQFWKGISKPRNSALASASVLAVVTMTMSMPRTASTLS